MVILAIDPGVSTGIAVKKDDKYFTATLSLDDIAQRKLEQLIAQADVIVYENFVGYRSHGMRIDANGFETVRIIGRIIDQCEREHKKFTKHAAQNRIAFMRKSKALFALHRVIAKRPTDHEKDALAHLLCLEWQLESPDTITWEGPDVQK